MALWQYDSMNIWQNGSKAVWQYVSMTGAQYGSYEMMTHPHQLVPLQSIWLWSLQSGSQRTETFHIQMAEQIYIKFKRQKLMREMKIPTVMLHKQACCAGCRRRPFPMQLYQ